MEGGALTVAPSAPTPTSPGDYGLNAVVVGGAGIGTFTLSGGTVDLTKSDLSVAVGPRRNLPGLSTFTMTAGAVTLGGTLSIAPMSISSSTTDPHVVTIAGGTFNIGQGVDVGHSSLSTQTLPLVAWGRLVVDGTAKVVVGNSLGEGNAAGVGGDGGLTFGRYFGGEGDLLVQGSAVVKAQRLFGGAGAGILTIKDDARVSIVNSLGAGSTVGASTAYNSLLGTPWNSPTGGERDGTESGSPRGRFHLYVQNNAVLDVDANAAGRDPTRPELQGLQIGGINTIIDVWDNAKLIVRQRLVIGAVGQGANLNGFNGLGDRGSGSLGTGTVWVTGGLVSADQLIVGGAGQGELDVFGGRVETKAYNATYDPTANGGAGSATTSVNAIRVGMLANTPGSLKVWGGGAVSTGELSIGHYGFGTLLIDEFKTHPGTATIDARDVAFQKFAGSKATLNATFRSKGFTTVRASNDVTINGGLLQLQAADLLPGAYRWDVLEADSDGDGSGVVRGRFTTVGASETWSVPGTPPSGRVFSVVYGPKKVIVGFTYPGDGDYSGTVNFDDLLILAKHYDQPAQWDEGDFTGDGVVNFDDLLVLAKNYNAGGTPAEVPGASAAFEADVAAAFAQAVPEPGAVGVLGLLAASRVAGRRRRRVG
jgi:hypothetical protein